MVGVPVQKASQCAQKVRRGGGRRQEEERRHVSFVGDSEARGEYCIHAQAELYVDASSSSFFLPPPSVIPSLFGYLTQLGQLRPPQAADTTMYKITCNERRNQFGTKNIVHTSTSGSSTLWKLQWPFSFIQVNLDWQHPPHSPETPER